VMHSNVTLFLGSIRGGDRLQAVIDLKCDSHFFIGFNNRVSNTDQSFDIPANQNARPYLGEEGRNLLVKVIRLDDDFSIHLSGASVLSSPWLSRG